MELDKITQKNNVLEIKTTDDEETLFSLIKVFLNENSNVEIAGVFKEHHLIAETKLFVKTKKDNSKEILKKELTNIKKELNKLIIK
jgi:DNA-directed RNA polymerase subunit L